MRSRIGSASQRPYESANTPLISYLNNAIKAEELFKLDRDYVVINGEVLTVDEHTGGAPDRTSLQRGSTRRIEAEGAWWRSATSTRRSATITPAELLPDVREALPG